MLMVGLEPRKQTDKFKIRYNMIVATTAAVIAKHRGFCRRSFMVSSRIKCSLFVLFSLGFI
jgi:hypothetical protein